MQQDIKKCKEKLKAKLQGLAFRIEIAEMQNKDVTELNTEYDRLKAELASLEKKK